MNYQIQNRSVSSMKERLDEMEEQQENNAPNLRLLQDFVKSGNMFSANNAPAKPAMNGNYIDKTEFEKLVERVNGNDSLIDGLISKVKKINSSLEGSSKVKTPAFPNSVDPKSFDERIKNLERMVGKLNSTDKPSKTNGIPLDFDLEHRIKRLEKEIDDLKISVPTNTAGSNDGTTHSSMNYNLKKKLEVVANDNQELKNIVNSCQQALESKADFEQLQEIDKVVTDKLNDCIKAVKRQMQERTESTKNLKKLEKQLRSLYDVLYNQIGGSEEEDDPLMDTKPVSAYTYSPYDKKRIPKGQLIKQPTWKKPPQTRKIIRNRSKYGKEMGKLLKNPQSDPADMRYYTVGPIGHNTQQDFYDV